MTDLIPHYRELAALGGNFRGLSLLQHADSIRDYIRREGAQTLLDYGSGAGDAYRSPHKVHQRWGLKRKDITLFDPAFKGIDKQPTGKFDMVVCSDVLEHIPEEEVDAFVEHLFRFARKAVWVSVCCRPAKKNFPGTDINLHVTVKPFAWWENRFHAECMHHAGVMFKLVETP